MEKRGPKGNEQDTVPVPLTVPASLHAYLTWLARHSMWGPTVQDVIVKIVTREAHAMYVADFHEKKLPPT